MAKGSLSFPDQLQRKTYFFRNVASRTKYVIVHTFCKSVTPPVSLRAVLSLSTLGAEKQIFIKYQQLGLQHSCEGMYTACFSKFSKLIETNCRFTKFHRFYSTNMIVLWSSSFQEHVERMFASVFSRKTEYSTVHHFKLPFLVNLVPIPVLRNFR